MHRRDLGEPHDDAILGGQRPPRLFDRDPRERRRHHEERALVERRHELGPEALKHRHGRDHEQHRSRDHEDPESHDQHRNRPVDRAQDPADGIGRLGAEPPAQQEHHQRRRERDRENRGGEHREGLRVGERREQLARLTGQREDRQEADGDQQEREEDRPADLLARVDDDLFAIRVRRRRREPHVRVLDQHDHRVGQLADGDGDPAERHDVGRQAQVPDRDERHQDGQRQHDHHDQRRSRVEQEDQADDRDDDRLLNQRVLQRVDGAEDQLRSVVGGDEANTVREAQRGDLGFERLDHLQRIRADAHHDDAAHRLARAVPVGGAATNLRPEADTRHVTEPDGRAARADGHHALLEVRQRLDVAATAKHVLATGQFEHARADFRVGVANRSRDIGQREPEAHEPIGVDDDLILAFESAERRDLRHTGDGLQRRPDGEVLQRPELGEIHRSGAVLQDVLVDPSQTARVGTERRGHIRRQQLLHAPQLLEHPRARPVDVGAVLERSRR